MIEQNREEGLEEITYFYRDNGNAGNYYLHYTTSPVSVFSDYKVEDNEKSQGNIMRSISLTKN